MDIIRIIFAILLLIVGVFASGFAGGRNFGGDR